MVNSDDYKDKHFTIEDSCAEGWLPITVEIDQAKITHLSPRATTKAKWSAPRRPFE